MDMQSLTYLAHSLSIIKNPPSLACKRLKAAPRHPPWLRDDYLLGWPAQALNKLGLLYYIDLNYITRSDGLRS